ncbi:NmrA/HSCARG family protein [Nocardia aurantia]|uniref:NmrA-like domain-containing protein n=1 Tax=Nocardia aurantia TaxID=2585199 RepID=A0A7K0DRT8_9NOCA|nr:NmrA/HSCARG family protein [Nocardia aurantia]MQY28451.1 hypothetical protein [Nocardia aurantia]
MANHANKIVVVTGATGRQGGAAATRLLADGWRVRALTRDASSESAQALRDKGAELVVGGQDERAVLIAAMTGAHGVFSVQPGLLGADPVAYDDEIAWGRNVVDAAVAADVEHLVYSSVSGAETAEGVASLEPKLRIEQHIAAAGIPATILRPVSFMENYADPAFGIGSGTLATAFAPEIPEQLIAATDIGAFVSLAFGLPGTYLHHTVAIAGDELTQAHIAHALTRAVGRKVTYTPVPIDTLRAWNADFAASIEYLDRRGGYRASVAETRRRHPSVLTFADWLAGGGAAAVARLFPDTTALDPADRAV